MKRKIIAALMTCFLTVSLAACGTGEAGSGTERDTSGEDQEQVQESQKETGQEQTQENTEEGRGEQDAAGSDILVAYFTYAENAELPEGADAVSSASIQVYGEEMTGNTGVVARMISEATGADLFSIQTAEKYPDNYDDTVDQGREEQDENARPELSTNIEDISAYNTVFLGYPNWWGDMPMAVYSFLDEYDLAGKTVIPFVTSGGSGFSRTVSEIESMEPDADVQEGIALRDSDAVNAQDDVNTWLSELGY